MSFALHVNLKVKAEVEVAVVAFSASLVSTFLQLVADMRVESLVLSGNTTYDVNLGGNSAVRTLLALGVVALRIDVSHIMLIDS